MILDGFLFGLGFLGACFLMMVLFVLGTWLFERLT